jgi:NarL family two-component system sensor histidine kinase LiaS
MDLHDGALADLYRVHLMGEVLKQDLLHGRLFDLEADIPELNQATTMASESLRSIIRSLQESSVGARGVGKTLESLVDDLAATTDATFHVKISHVGAAPSVQLAAYQVAREALENAMRHSKAKHISLSLGADGQWMRLIVRDDGSGFVTSQVDSASHFGLRIMSHRVQRAGGELDISSRPGLGTQVVARFPRGEA